METPPRSSSSDLWIMFWTFLSHLLLLQWNQLLLWTIHLSYLRLEETWKVKVWLSKYEMNINDILELFWFFLEQHLDWSSSTAAITWFTGWDVAFKESSSLKTLLTHAGKPWWRKVFRTKFENIWIILLLLHSFMFLF